VTQTVEETTLLDFQQNSAEYTQRLSESGAPLLLTLDDGRHVVVQDAEAYDRILDRIEYDETVAAVRAAMASHARGESRPAQKVLDEIRAKHGIPR
jgi:hypothetical protein